MVDMGESKQTAKSASPVGCPHCGNIRIIDAGLRTIAVATIADEEHIRDDFYIKCWKCKKEIGLTKKRKRKNICRCQIN